MKSEEFFREVNEELQRDRLLTLWRRYGGLVVGLVLLAVVGTASWVGWTYWQQQARAAEGERFAAAEAALAGERPADAAAAFAGLAAEGETGFAALARLKEAEAKAALRDAAGARDALAALAGSAQADPILRDLGTVLSAARALDTAEPAELRARLEPAAAAGAPWRHHANELLAVLAIRAGDLETARRLLGGLAKEVGVPPALQRRASELLQAIGGAPQRASS